MPRGNIRSATAASVSGPTAWRPSATSCETDASARPTRVAIAPAPAPCAFTASSIPSARAIASLRPSSNVRLPAYTSAASSPTLWPASARHCATDSGSSHAILYAPASATTNAHGCECRASISRASGPSRHRLSTSWPRTADARAKRPATRGTWTSRRPIPVKTPPLPPKSTAQPGPSCGMFTHGGGSNSSSAADAPSSALSAAPCQKSDARRYSASSIASTSASRASGNCERGAAVASHMLSAERLCRAILRELRRERGEASLSLTASSRSQGHTLASASERSNCASQSPRPCGAVRGHAQVPDLPDS